MKLIIDIDEQHFELLQMAVMNGMGDNAQKIIAQGIPFDKIRDEIEQTADEEQKHDKKWAIGLRYAIKIIDKYKAEGGSKE